MSAGRSRAGENDAECILNRTCQTAGSNERMETAAVVDKCIRPRESRSLKGERENKKQLTHVGYDTCKNEGYMRNRREILQEIGVNCGLCRERRAKDLVQQTEIMHRIVRKDKKWSRNGRK